MMIIFQFIIVIFAGFSSIAFFIKLLRAFKAGREQQIREGNFNREGMSKGSKKLLFMLVSSIIISIILVYVRNLEFSISNIIWGAVTILVCELIIGSTWETIQQVIMSYKKYGLVKTILIVICVTIALAAVLYVKYTH